MIITDDLSEKEIARRKKISAKMSKIKAKRRKEGYERWVKQKRKEKEKAKRLKEKEKAERSEKLKKARLKRRNEKRKEERRRKRMAERKAEWVEMLKIKNRDLVKNKIIICKDQTEDSTVGCYIKFEDAEKEFRKMKEMSDKVVFPELVLSVDSGKEVVYEVLLLEIDHDNVKENAYSKNKIGQYVPVETTSNKWVIADSFVRKTEETFWIWGYDPKTERKTITWIFENMMMQHYGILRLYVFRNKFIIKDDDGNFEIIMCKNSTEAVKFYNMVKGFSEKEKITTHFYLGNFVGNTQQTKDFTKEISENTGIPVNILMKKVTKKHPQKKSLG